MLSSIYSLWNFEKCIARFVEVKGPGDNLSETQKVGIDLTVVTGSTAGPTDVRRIGLD